MDYNKKMNYLTEIPTEIKYLIFSYLPYEELLKLYSHNNPEYVQMLSDSQFWAIYFSQHDLPIMRKCNNFIAWYTEYMKTYNLYHSIQSEIRYNLSFDFRSIYPIDLLQEYITEKQITESFINYHLLIFDSNLLKLSIYDNHGNFTKLSTDKSKIFDLLFKLKYHGNGPYVFNYK